MHPSHVPLVCESETAVLDLVCDLGPCRGLFRDHHYMRIMISDHSVQLPEELDNLEVLITAVDIRQILLPAVVSVEHRRHCIDPETVKVEFLEPEYGIGDKERDDLVLGVIKYVCTPLPVLAEPRVCILVARCSVKSYETFEVLREMSGNPVKDDTDSVLVENIDHELEVSRSTEPARYCIIACNLITPGSIERVL